MKMVTYKISFLKPDKAGSVPLHEKNASKIVPQKKLKLEIYINHQTKEGKSWLFGPIEAERW